MLDRIAHCSPMMIFENETAWQECLQWCIKHYGSTDASWNFYHTKDLFGRYESQFKFLSREDLVEFLLVWYNNQLCISHEKNY